MNEKKKIIICGAGTVGGNLAENMARMGFRELTVIDRDRVEERNLANQPYLSMDVGQPKVKALAAFLYRAVAAEVATIHKELTAGNSDKLLRPADIVIDAFDSEISRRAVAESCRRQNIPCLHAGISDDGYGEIIWNDHYKVPRQQEGDACEMPQNRTLSLLVISIATEVIRSFLEHGIGRNYCVTIRDLHISELQPPECMD